MDLRSPTAAAARADAIWRRLRCQLRLACPTVGLRPAIAATAGPGANRMEWRCSLWLAQPTVGPRPQAQWLLPPPWPIQPLHQQTFSNPFDGIPWPWQRLGQWFPLWPGDVPVMPVRGFGGDSRSLNWQSMCDADPGELRAVSGPSSPLLAIFLNRLAAPLQSQHQSPKHWLCKPLQRGLERVLEKPNKAEGSP